MPKISVCIPVYNCEKYIGPAIESVLAQTYTDFELIIINNCSTDNTRDVISKYADNRITVFDNETNIGAEGNWNKALEKANGEYIKLLCADDVLYPTALEKQLEKLESPENSGVVMACSGRDVIAENEKPLLTRSFTGVRGRIPGLSAVKKCVRHGRNFIGEPSAVLFRRDAAVRAGKFDISIPYVIDLDYWFRLLLTGDLYVIPESLCAFRVSASSWSVVTAKSQATDNFRFFDKIRLSRKYGVNRLDTASGKLHAYLNNQLRIVFYRFILKKA